MMTNIRLQIRYLPLWLAAGVITNLCSIVFWTSCSAILAWIVSIGGGSVDGFPGSGFLMNQIIGTWWIGLIMGVVIWCIKPVNVVIAAVIGASMLVVPIFIFALVQHWPMSFFFKGIYVPFVIVLGATPMALLQWQGKRTNWRLIPGEDDAKKPVKRVHAG